MVESLEAETRAFKRGIAVQMTTLRDITAKFEAAHPKRARGGRWALAGFRYQFQDSLLRFFQPIVEGKPPEFAIFDSLSDLSVERADYIFVSQHKRTLRRSNYVDAISEFIAINEFMIEHFPADVAKLKFQIVTSQSTIAETASLPPEIAAPWQSITSQGRFGGIIVQPEPWAELLKLLWPNVKHPYQVAVNCTHHLLSGLAGGISADDLCDRLIKEYEHDLQATTGELSPLLTVADFEQDPSTSSRILLQASVRSLLTYALAVSCRGLTTCSE